MSYQTGITWLKGQETPDPTKQRTVSEWMINSGESCPVCKQRNGKWAIHWDMHLHPWCKCTTKSVTATFRLTDTESASDSYFDWVFAQYVLPFSSTSIHYEGERYPVTNGTALSVPAYFKYKIIITRYTDYYYCSKIFDESSGDGIEAGTVEEFRKSKNVIFIGIVLGKM